MLAAFLSKGTRVKLASYLHKSAACYGIVEGGGIVDLSARLGARFPDIKTLIAHEGLDEARKAGAGRKADLGLSEVKLLPTIPNPGKIFCIGLNYEDHRQETKREKTEAPAVFVRFRSRRSGTASPSCARASRRSSTSKARSP